MPRLRVPATAGVVLVASGMTTLGSLPVFLLGSQSVFVRAELGFGEGRFGLVVSAFFAAAASTALLGGGLVDRLGQRYGTVVAGALAAVGGLGVALLAHGWLALLLLMVLLGMANAACQVTSNLTMARAVPPHRRGLGFGVKQAAVPLSIMISGLAVPLVAAVVGWRWTFAATGVCGVALVAWGFTRPSGSATPARPGQGVDKPALAPLLMTMVAVTVASAAANSLGSFIASWGFHVGLTPSQAGALMAVGSGTNVAMRVLVGHLADQRHGRNLPVVAVQMLVGAVSLAVLAAGTPVTVVVAGFVALALGWSWPGLLLYAVVRVGRDAPGRASGVVQAGAFAGGAAGPAAFGAVVGLFGYETAWQSAATLFLLAAGLVLLARRMFIADLVARPPLEPLAYGGGRRSPARTTEPPDDAGLS